MSAREVLLLLVLGISGVALNQGFFIVGLGRTSVAHAAILMGLTPVQVLSAVIVLLMRKSSKALVLRLSLLSLLPPKSVGSGRSLAHSNPLLGIARGALY